VDSEELLLMNEEELRALAQRVGIPLLGAESASQLLNRIVDAALYTEARGKNDDQPF